MVLGFCRPQASAAAQSLNIYIWMINVQVQCPVLLWVWLQFELVCDDPRNTVLMNPPSLSHYCLEGEDVEMASLDVEMMKWEWIICGRSGEGRTGGMASEVYMDKGMCKSQTAGWPPDQPKCKQRERMVIVCWIKVLEDSVSMCLWLTHITFLWWLYQYWCCVSADLHCQWHSHSDITLTLAGE